MKSIRYAIKVAILSVFFVVFFSAGCAKAPASPDVPVVSSDNKPPVISDISFPEDVMSLTDNLITCTANDPDGDDLTYVWSADGGIIKGEGLGIVWMAPDSVGKYEVNVVVNDGKGGEASRAVTIRVVTNADGSTNRLVKLNLSLSSSDLVIQEGRARTWTTTEVICEVDGDTGDGLTYTWSAKGGKLQGKGLAEGTANRVGWIAPGGAGEFSVAVTVTDNTGKTATGQVNFTVFCCTDE